LAERVPISPKPMISTVLAVEIDRHLLVAVLPATFPHQPVDRRARRARDIISKTPASATPTESAVPPLQPTLRGRERVDVAGYARRVPV